MKSVTISLDDEVYERATREASRKRKSIGEFLRDLFSSRFTNDAASGETSSPDLLPVLWALADSKPVTPGTVGPLNRDEIYERGLP